MPITERSLLILLTIVAVISGSVAALSSYQMFPIVSPYELVIRMDDTLEHFSTIKNLEKKGLSTRQVIAQYLLENYVVTREKYNYEDFEQQFKRMRGASSKKVFREFKHEMDLKNPLSRPLIYGKDIVRNVNVLSFAFDRVGRHTEAAAVVFETTVKSDFQKAVSTERWGARIEYTLSDIDEAMKTKKLEFIVTNYKVKKL